MSFFFNVLKIDFQIENKTHSVEYVLANGHAITVINYVHVSVGLKHKYYLSPTL